MRNRKKFTKEQKDWAIDEFIAGSLTVDQIAEQLDCEPQYIYRWKVQREERQKDRREKGSEQEVRHPRRLQTGRRKACEEIQDPGRLD